MIVYQADKTRFLQDADDREIDDVILRHYRAATGGDGVGTSERRAWRESRGRMAGVLRDPGIPGDVGVGVEFHVQATRKRIDVTLTGIGADGADRAVIVELK